MNTEKKSLQLIVTDQITETAFDSRIPNYSETRICGGTTVSRIRYVSDTDTPRIHRGYVSNPYRRIGLYWAWKLKIGYVSVCDTA